MYLRFRIITIICFLGIQVVFFSLATTEVSAGLHFTAQEIAIWQSRKDNGPYKDEWDRILSRANAWKASPGPRFLGHTSDTCYTGSPAIPSSRSFDDGLRDAAFVYLITGNTSYRDVARTALLEQVDITGTNFSNAIRWCPTTATFNGYGDNLTPWIRKLVYGYAYIRESLAPVDRSKLDSWFLNAGKHVDSVLHNIVKKRFPDRQKDNYSCSQLCPGDSIGVTHYQGHIVYRFGEAWNNKGTSLNATVAAIGSLLGDPALLGNAKRYVKEWVKYGTYPGAQVHDQFRWGGVYASSTTSPQHAFLYAGASIGSIVSAVDHIARSGDTSLYEFETTEGMYGSQGGPKSLKRILQHFAGMSTGSIIEYATSSAVGSRPGLIIKPENKAEFGQSRVEFVNIAPASTYFKDAIITSAYQLPIPSGFTTSGCNMLQGEWCTYPSIRFMFGQMEGKVWPYPATGGVLGTKPLPNPTGLNVRR
jgi:hypothetical protein